MSYINSFLKIIKSKNISKLQVLLDSAKQPPNLIIYSNEKSLLQDLSNNLLAHLGSKLPIITEVAELTEKKAHRPDRHSISLSPNQVTAVCKSLKLKYGYEEIKTELIKTNKVLDNGSKNDNADKLEQFKQEYFKQYNSEWFKNPKSTMKARLEGAPGVEPINSIQDVEQYAKKHPDSRTTEVLSSLKYK